LLDRQVGRLCAPEDLVHIDGAAAHAQEYKAQQAAKVPQIGYLSYGSPAEAANRVRALRLGLREHGYVEGKSINLAFRWAETPERLRELAADLVRLKVDLIFAPTSTEVDAARQATRTIPIVFAGHADPVGVGHVAGLARPGGNITGLSALLTEIVAKQLEIVQQALPHMKRIGVLVTMTAPSHSPALHAIEATAQRLGVQVLTVPVRTPEDLDGAFAMMVRERVNGFPALATPLIRAQRAVLAELSRFGYPFNSRFSSLRKRQSVPWAMIFCGFALIMPASRSRSA
jgi:putative ABC transport system substrate-binding protein